MWAGVLGGIPACLHITHLHICQSRLICCRDILGQAGFAGIPAAEGKPTKRTYNEPIFKSYHLHGAGVNLDAQMPAWRKSRGWGERPRYAMVNTAARTIGTGTGDHQVVIYKHSVASSLKSW